MPRQLHLSAIIELPTDVFEAAAAMAKIADPWAKLLDDLETAGVKHVAKHETLETRAKTERAPRKPRANGPGAKAPEPAAGLAV